MQGEQPFKGSQAVLRAFPLLEKAAEALNICARIVVMAWTNHSKVAMLLSGPIGNWGGNYAANCGSSSGQKSRCAALICYAALVYTTLGAVVANDTCNNL